MEEDEVKEKEDKKARLIWISRKRFAQLIYVDDGLEDIIDNIIHLKYFRQEDPTNANAQASAAALGPITTPSPFSLTPPLSKFVKGICQKNPRV